MAEDGASAADFGALDGADATQLAAMVGQVTDEQLAEGMANPEGRRMVLDEIFRRMALLKANDERCRKMITSGRLMMPYYSYRGQEVIPSAMAVTLFLGGGMWPWPLSFLNAYGWLQFVAFIGKILMFLFVFIWLRGTLPRFRYDQFMKLGWKVLIPTMLVWTVAIFGIRTFRTTGGDNVVLLLSLLGFVLAVVVAVAFLLPDRKVGPAPVEPASDYPVPPLDLEVPAAPPRRRKAVPAGEAVPAGKDAR